MKIDDPAFNYDERVVAYSGHRKTDPSIAAYIYNALDSAKNVLNVGAGSGSYEPDDRFIVSIEPSSSMRRQRLEMNRRPAIIASAEALPFDDKSFDASMAILTVHHWLDLSKGLREIRRVTKGKIIIMTYDPEALDTFWNSVYFPELINVEQARYPKIKTLIEILGGQSVIIPIPIPLNCLDGFQEAFYGRPEEFLKTEVRKAQSAWGFLQNGLEEKYVKSLADELASGEWDRKFGHFRMQDEFKGSLRLIVNEN